MKDKLARVYDIIQNLQLQPTRGNVGIIAECLALLEEVYKELDGNEKAEQTTQGTEEIVVED